MAVNGASTQRILPAPRLQVPVSQFLHVNPSSRHGQRESTPSKASTWAKTKPKEWLDRGSSPDPISDSGANQSTPYDDEDTHEGLLDLVLNEFKDVFGATARHCVSDADFEPNVFPFERFFLGNLAHGKVVYLEEELGSDSDELSPTTQIRYEKSYENRFDVLFDKLALSYKPSEDAVSLYWTSFVTTHPRYIRSMVVADLPLDQDSLPPPGYEEQLDRWRDDSVLEKTERLYHYFRQYYKVQFDTRQERSIVDPPDPQLRLSRTKLRKHLWLLLKAMKQTQCLRRFLRYRDSPKRTYMYVETRDFVDMKDESEIIAGTAEEVYVKTCL